MNNALSSSISAILPIQTATVGEYAHQTANARDLHSWLEVGKDFSTWIKNRIEQYDFTENVDYIKVPEAPQFGALTPEEVDSILCIIDLYADEPLPVAA